jgi:hypothetical protein
VVTGANTGLGFETAQVSHPLVHRTSLPEQLVAQAASWKMRPSV